MRAFALAVAVAGCGSTPAHVSPPFSAAELRAGLPAGTEIKLRVKTAALPAVIEHWTFTAVDDRGCTIHARVLDESGAVIRDEGSGTSTWAELESHAHFPKERTTRSESIARVPAGTFETWLFEVGPEKPDGPISRYHFAKTLPGPPILMEVISAGERVRSIELISRTP